MKLAAVIAFVVFSFFTSENDTDKIAWSEHTQLSWSDFEGKPNKGADYVASTNSGISFSYSYKLKNGEMTYEYSIESHFYKKESWFKKERVSAYILKHEQTHFDISELHARILRRKISEVRFTKNIKKEMEGLYKKVELQRREMQNTFDKETDHSKNPEKEYSWETFIAKQLKVYERWR